MEEISIKEETSIKEEITENPVPLVGNMKNKLNSLLKLGQTKTENPDGTTILSLSLLGRKSTHKNKNDSPAKTVNLDEVPNKVIKPILNISKLKENLNRRIKIAAGIKSEPDEDEDMPLKSLKRKLNDTTVVKKPATSTLPSVNIFSLKNKLGTALKVGETLQKPKMERKPKKHGFIVDINNIIADKKNNIYYCKYCFKYFQNVVTLRYHVLQHGRPKQQILEVEIEEETKKKKNDVQLKKVIFEKVTTTTTTMTQPEKVPQKNGKQQTQCDICQKWFINVSMHKSRAHKNTK